MYKKFIGLTGADIIYKKLLEYGVNTVSIYSGGAIMPLVDKFNYSKNKHIKYYVHSHEQMCGHSSTGYAKVSGKMGVSIVTSGPGLTNMITPMLDATNDSTPLMVISGQVSRNVMGTLAFQECPAIDITKPVTKFSHCINSVEEIPQIMDIAYYLANNNKKGTVHIDLPKCVANDIFKGTLCKKSHKNNILKYTDLIKSSKLKYNKYPTELYKSSNDKKYIKEISEKINNSNKPILYLGQGVNGLSKQVLEFIEKNNIPVTTTIHALGIIDQLHDLSLKWLGMHGYAPANYAIQESDCIICIGARFDDRTTGDIKKYAPKAKDIIHVNIEKNEIKKIVNSNYNVVDTAENFFNKINIFSKYKKREKWINKLNSWKKEYPFEYDILDNKLNMPMVISEINKQIKDNTIITTGVGTHQMQTAQFIDWKPGMRFISSGSLGVMGVGIPYGIGAKLAKEDSDVIIIDGDASSLMTISDLKTIKQYNIPVKIIILNNNKQGMVYIWEELFFNKRITATEYDSNPSFVELANSFGIKSLYCEEPTKLESTINKFINYNGPILMECKVENDICTPLVKPGGGLDEMIFKKDYLNKIKMNGIVPN
tara:strand:+ start:1754 stop:3544 length:1791 start_codon:yes stop_codon:yes gene_type:complete